MKDSVAKVNRINQSNDFKNAISQLSKRKLLDLIEDEENTISMCINAVELYFEASNPKVEVRPDSLAMEFVHYRQLVNEL
ncbi:MAG TPA: hypothetical protein VJ991_08230 [Balneolales bacterium]|nr:hypothetical protein [Balneolales bacterium]